MDPEDNYASILENPNGQLTDILLSDDLDEQYTNLQYPGIFIWKEVNNTWEDLALYWQPNQNPTRTTHNASTNHHQKPN